MMVSVANGTKRAFERRPYLALRKWRPGYLTTRRAEAVEPVERLGAAFFAVLFGVALRVLLAVELEEGFTVCCACLEAVRVTLTCADLRTWLTRAAPADDASNRSRQPAMKTGRNIRGARRNQSIFSVRRAAANLECRAWFR